MDSLKKCVSAVIFPENMCRLCVELGESMVDIDETVIDYGDNLISLLELLNVFSYIELNENYPNKICTECLTKATELYQFKIQCDKSTQIIEELRLTAGADEISEIDTEERNCEEYEEITIIENKFDLTNMETNEDTSENHVIKNANEDGSESPMPIKEEFTPFTCYTCGKYFPQKDALENHILTHTFTKYPELQDLKEESLHKCWKCKQPFLSKLALRRHQATQCVVMPHICKKCNRQFKRATAFKYHMMMHNNDKPFVCNVCGKNFVRRSTLQVHIRDLHTEEAVKPFLCPICGWAFRVNSHLRTHIETHSTEHEKKYQCEKCGRKFAQFAYLRQHYLTHEGERPFKCKHCDKAFSRGYALKRHEYVHVGSKPHPCKLCDKAFIQLSALKRHLAVHTYDKEAHVGKNSTKRVKVKIDNSESYILDIRQKDEESKNSTKRVKVKNDDSESYILDILQEDEES